MVDLEAAQAVEVDDLAGFAGLGLEHWEDLSRFCGQCGEGPPGPAAGPVCALAVILITWQ